MHTTYVFTPNEPQVLTEKPTQALSSYPESIESYQTALAALPTANLTATEKSLKSGGEKALANVMSKLLNPYTMSVIPPSPSSFLHFRSDTPPLPGHSKPSQPSPAHTTSPSPTSTPSKPHPKSKPSAKRCSATQSGATNPAFASSSSQNRRSTRSGRWRSRRTGGCRGRYVSLLDACRRSR
jgi:hypothetical protein